MSSSSFQRYEGKHRTQDNVDHRCSTKYESESNSVSKFCQKTRVYFGVGRIKNMTRRCQGIREQKGMKRRSVSGSITI